MPPRRSQVTSRVAANADDKAESADAKSTESPKRRTSSRGNAASAAAPASNSNATEKKSKRKADAVETNGDGNEEAHAIEEEGKPVGKGKKKRTKSSSKAETEGGEEEPVSPSAPTKAFAEQYGDNASAEGIPRDTFSLQDKVLDYAKRPEGQVRITSWNITSFNSCEKKGLFKYLEAEAPDIVVLTETKVNDPPDMHPSLAAYPHRAWGIDSNNKGYAGVAVLSKIKPLKVTIGMPEHPKVCNGRIITLEFEKTFLVGTYVTNAGEGLAKMADKQKWHDAFARYITSLDVQKPVIWCGDLNVAADQRDLSSAKKKWNKQPGYTQIETDAHRRLLGGETGVDGAREFVDVWRETNPDAVGQFTFYSFRGACRGKGIGWRLDSFIMSERLFAEADFFQKCEIRHEVYGPSDHVPVVCDVMGPL